MAGTFSRQFSMRIALRPDHDHDGPWVSPAATARTSSSSSSRSLRLARSPPPTNLPPLAAGSLLMSQRTGRG